MIVECVCGNMFNYDTAKECECCKESFCHKCLPQDKTTCKSCRGIEVPEKLINLRVYKNQDKDKAFIDLGSGLVIALFLWLTASLIYCFYKII